MTNADQMRKVRNLLKKAEAEGVTEPEAEAFRAKAFELAAKYEISAAEAMAGGKGEREKVIDTKFPVVLPTIQMLNLVNTVSRNSGCSMLRLGKEVAHVFGHESDLERFKMLWASVVVQGERACASSYTGPGGRLYRRYRRSWWENYNYAISGRMAAARAAAKSASTVVGTDIALRDKSKAVDDAIAGTYTRLGNGRRQPGTRSGDGAMEGYQAGMRADLGGSSVGGGHKELS